MTTSVLQMTERYPNAAGLQCSFGPLVNELTPTQHTSWITPGLTDRMQSVLVGYFHRYTDDTWLYVSVRLTVSLPTESTSKVETCERLKNEAALAPNQL